jgi:hypothetical protein
VEFAAFEIRLIELIVKVGNLTFAKYHQRRSENGRDSHEPRGARLDFLVLAHRELNSPVIVPLDRG